MEKLSFYEVDRDYIKYLKSIDKRVPDVIYDKHNKFVCGIVISIDNVQYYSPVSHFSQQQRTNFLIKNEEGKSISSLRFCFMFPAYDDVLKIKDFNKEEYKYKRLLMQELKYCNDNIDKVIKKAQDTYKIGTNRKHPLFESCCNFKLLEEKYLGYNIVKETIKEVALSKKD